MRRHWILPFTLLLSAPLFSQQQQAEPLVPPQEINKELASAEAEFQEAKKMFNPWYTGPLLTPSAHVLPVGNYLIQPYVFFVQNYAHYDEHGHSHSVPHLNQIKPSLSPFQYGITEWMDGTLSFGGVRNHQQGQTHWDWSDTTASFGFGLLNESAYRPAIKFVVQESFPTGNYQKFHPKKANVASTGSGSFETQFSLNISKVVWWASLHPMNFRTSFNYTVNSNVHVKGFNTYGGGLGTRGTVKGGTHLRLILDTNIALRSVGLQRLILFTTTPRKILFQVAPSPRWADPLTIRSVWHLLLSIIRMQIVELSLGSGLPCGDAILPGSSLK